MSRHPATPAAATQRSQLSWWESLCERCFTSAAPSVAQALALEGGPTYRELIVDLEAPLAPAFERAVARTLDRDSLTGLIPAETLMPAMMQRFGLGRTDYVGDEAQAFKAMERTCNRCVMAGHCWKAMRHDASAETCRGFCPNAEAFDRKAADLAS